MSHSNTRDVEADRALADFVKQTPAAARVFDEVGLDYYCGGDVSLKKACQEEDVELSKVRDRLSEMREEAEDTTVEWEKASSLIEVILEDHHEYLREELPELRELAEKVARAHSDSHPELDKVRDEFEALADDFEEHIVDEEENLFPAVEKMEKGEELTEGEAEDIKEHIYGYLGEHEETAARLKHIKELTDGYAVPEDACASHESLLHRLEELEHNTHMHIYRENNVLFPKVEEMMAST